MLRYAFRRLLWVFPGVVGVSLITFFVLSLVPGAADRAAGERGKALPLFFNVRPVDVRARTERAAAELLEVEGPEQQAAASAELVRLGGAGLVHLLPQLDAYPPEQRQRIALALAPLAERMGLEDRRDATDPRGALLFWQHFWGTRGIEFRQATARAAVGRYVRHGSEARARELRVLDTFALVALMEKLERPVDAAGLARTRRVIELLAHVSARDDRLLAEAGIDEALDAVDRWQVWWMQRRTDFVQLAGASRVAAFVLEAQYGKWAYEAVVLRLGKDASGRRVADELVARSRVTLAVLLLGVLLAYALAIPLGVAAAWWRGRAIDRVVSVSVLLPYALSPAVLALTLAGGGWAAGAPRLAAASVLALALMADPTRQQRAALLPVLTEDYMTAARARGAGPLRLVVVHALRNALLPLTTRAAIEIPVALTGCFVIERAFNMRGLGEVAVEAARIGDSAWLMTLALCGALLAVTVLVVSDIVHGLLDPRARHSIGKIGGRQT